MPIQAPQWTDFKLCPICQNEFNSVQRLPVSLGCGHSICQSCLLRLSRQQCPFDMAEIQIEISKLPVNYALLSLVGGSIPDTFPVDVPDVCQNRRHFDSARRSIEYLAQFLQNCSATGNGSSSANANGGMTRPMQRKLITLIHSQLAEVEGRCRAVRAARSIGERAVKELILMHQSPQTLSATLWAAVRQRGCQFLGPAMQEAVLQLILLTLEDGVPLSRKVLVLYVVQKLETQFTQASKTSIGHVVQLLYRASCFKVTKREGDSSLLQLHEKYRTYTALRKEHDAQIVNIASEAGLHISPEQWSALLYGDDEHKSHMQSIIDKLQTPASFGSSIQELIIALQRTNDPHNLQDLRPHLELLSRLDPANEAPAPTWQQLEDAMQSLKLVMGGLHSFARDYAAKNRGNIEGAQMINTKYRTSMCRDIVNRNNCPRGANCNFAHSEEELDRYRKRRHVPGMRPQVTPAATMAASNISAAHSLRSGSSSSPDSIDTDDLDSDFHGDEYMINDPMSNGNQPTPALAPATVSFRPVVPAAANPGGMYHPSQHASQHVGMLSDGYQQPAVRRNLATPATGVSFRPVVTAASNPGGMYPANHHASQQVDIISDGLKSMSVSSARPTYGDQFQQPAVRRSLPNGMMKYQAPYAYCEVAPQSPVPIYVTQTSQPSYIGTCAAPMYQPQITHPLYPYPTEVYSGNPCHQMFSVPAAYPRYAVARSCEIDDESSSELSLKIPSGKDDAKDDWKFGASNRSLGESYRDSGRCSSLGYSSDTFSPLSSSSTGSRASPPSSQGASSGVWDSLFPNEQNSIWAPQPSKLSNWTVGATSPIAASGVNTAGSGGRPHMMDWENLGPRNPARKEEAKDPVGRAKDLLGASTKGNDHAFDDWKSWPREERKNADTTNQSLLREIFSPNSRPSYGFGFI